MSNRFFQSVIIQMKDATDRVIGVMDSDGVITASSELSLIGTQLENAGAIIEEAAEPIVSYKGKTFKSLSGWNTNFDYAVFVDGEDENAREVPGHHQFVHLPQPAVQSLVLSPAVPDRRKLRLHCGRVRNALAEPVRLRRTAAFDPRGVEKRLLPGTRGAGKFHRGLQLERGENHRSSRDRPRRRHAPHQAARFSDPRIGGCEGRNLLV